MTCSSRTHTEFIVAFPLQKWLRERDTNFRHIYIAYVGNLYRTVWKWFTGSTDRTFTDPLQATALTHIIHLQVSNSLQCPAIYSYIGYIAAELRKVYTPVKNAKTRSDVVQIISSSVTGLI